ncbi:hypothetical protein TWF281_004510 [Arthrobotrys megalospora]
MASCPNVIKGERPSSSITDQVTRAARGAMDHSEALQPKTPEGLKVFEPTNYTIGRSGRHRQHTLNRLLSLLGIALVLLGAAFFTAYISAFHFPKSSLPILRDKLSHTKDLQSQARRQKAQELCPLVESIYPDIDTPGLRRAHSLLHSPQYLFRSAKALGDAVRVRTSVYDNFGDVNEDERWDRMEPFLRYLRQTFPLINTHLSFERINKYGLLYTWEGSDRDLKPILLTAHQDVVPVEEETLGEWEYDPFSGHFDGKNIWGRGSIDDKNQLVAIMESIDLLLYGGYRPTRSVVLAFGFDEELGGGQGARYLGRELDDRYGPNGFSMIVDEGSGMAGLFGSDFTVVSTAEKGFMNQQITIKTVGGHSSIPPPHSSIGMISEFVVELENYPFEIEFSDDNPLYDLFTCAAAHAKDFPDELSSFIEDGDRQGLADAIIKFDPRYEADLRSTVAVTTIQGGTKLNALPEFVTVGVNHRIRRGSSISEIANATIEIASKIAKKHNLELIIYPEEEARYPESSITLQMASQRDPSPLTSSRTDIFTPYKLIAGTSRALFGEDIFVTPGLNMGNTDTFWYTGLSENIFRYAPMPVVKKNMHGVNEHVTIEGHLAMVEWFYTFLLNVNEVNEW